MHCCTVLLYSMRCCTSRGVVLRELLYFKRCSTSGGAVIQELLYFKRCSNSGGAVLQELLSICCLRPLDAVLSRHRSWLDVYNGCCALGGAIMR